VQTFQLKFQKFQEEKLNTNKYQVIVYAIINKDGHTTHGYGYYDKTTGLLYINGNEYKSIDVLMYALMPEDKDITKIMNESIVSNDKRHEYWNYFIAEWAIDKNHGPHGLTSAKLRKIKPRVMKDDMFWYDIILRHEASFKTPLQLFSDDKVAYDHLAGNFWNGLGRFIH